MTTPTREGNIIIICRNKEGRQSSAEASLRVSLGTSTYDHIQPRILEMSRSPRSKEREDNLHKPLRQAHERRLERRVTSQLLQDQMQEITQAAVRDRKAECDEEDYRRKTRARSEKSTMQKNAADSRHQACGSRHGSTASQNCSHFHRRPSRLL